MDAGWICPFCKGSGKISDQTTPPTQLDTAETVFLQGCTHCLGTGKIEVQEENPFAAYDDIFSNDEG